MKAKEGGKTDHETEVCIGKSEEGGREVLGRRKERWEG